MNENTLKILVVMISHAMTKQGKSNVLARCAGEMTLQTGASLCPWDDVHVMEKVPYPAMAYALGVSQVEQRESTYVMEGDILTGVAFLIEVDEDSQLSKYVPKEYKS